jgi:Zn-dependent protease with chaperone function
VTLPYFFRLLCLCLGCFFAVHLAAGLVVGFCARPAIGLALRRKPRAGARLLLALRLLPPGVALLFVTTLCVPSYLWLEPRASLGEEMGFAILAAALGGGALWCVSLTRALAASVRSSRYLRRCRRAATRSRMAGRPVWIVDRAAPQVILAGVFRPRMVISRSVAGALSPEQLDAALRHEHAHWTARDNFKRLLLLLSPGWFPFSAALEHAWAQMAEWAADDRAVAGDAARSLSLAAVLLAVARMGAPAAPHRLATSLLAGAQDLAARVDRLLAAVPPADEPAPAGAFWTAATAVLAIAAAVWIAQPAALTSVHLLLERLAR